MVERTVVALFFLVKCKADQDVTADGNYKRTYMQTKASASVVTKVETR